MGCILPRRRFSARSATAISHLETPAPTPLRRRLPRNIHARLESRCRASLKIIGFSVKLLLSPPPLLGCFYVKNRGSSSGRGSVSPSVLTMQRLEVGFPGVDQLSGAGVELVQYVLQSQEWKKKVSQCVFLMAPF